MKDAGGQAPATVLVVEDEPSMRLLCRVNLELDGHRVLEAGSLAEARAQLAEQPPDVVLLDVHLGAEHGGSLIADCHGLSPPVPVVLVTGSQEGGDGGVAEADAILPKPFELDELRATVRSLSLGRLAP